LITKCRSIELDVAWKADSLQGEVQE